MSAARPRSRRRSAVLLVVIFLAGAVLGSRISGSAGERVIYVPAPTSAARAVPLEPSAPPPVASPGCDEVDRLFIQMFAGLSDAALSNAGIDRDAFNAAMNGDRATFKRYLEALGITVDDAQMDALMAGFPSASGLPLDTLGDC
jgi:hypothetical protein